MKLSQTQMGIAALFILSLLAEFVPFCTGQKPLASCISNLTNPVFLVFLVLLAVWFYAARSKKND
jgi:hypothetical protein